VEESVEDFDKVMEIDPRYGDVLWQRGLSLYYLDRFDDAAAQFQRDVRLNPRDSEEAIWNLISLARKREFEGLAPLPTRSDASAHTPDNVKTSRCKACGHLNVCLDFTQPKLSTLKL
jgi:lipoprotein NlpI